MFSNRSPIAQTRQWKVRATPLVLVALLALGLVATGIGGAGAAPGADWSRLVVTRAVGESRADPVPLGDAGEAGPLTITVLAVQTGDEAAAAVTGASQFNDPPADGFQYVAVQLRVENAGDQPIELDGNDFGVTGSSGFVRRFLGAVPPDPALDGSLAPGEAKEGWVVAGATVDETNLLLLFDSLALGGTWADRLFALQEGSAIPNVDDRPVALNRVGRDPGKPAAVGEAIVTRDWAIEVLDFVEGQGVYDLFTPADYGTTALADAQGGANVPLWIAFRLKITNNRTGGSLSELPPTAFQLAAADGEPIADYLTLTPPRPDAAGGYYPGATREGWVAFERTPDYAGALVRFLPYSTDADPRFFTWDASAVVPSAPAGPIDAGSTVVTTEENVRLRAAPSTSAEIVAELARGTELTVTGPGQDADGYTWYPVDNPATGESGYVAANFIRPT